MIGAHDIHEIDNNNRRGPGTQTPVNGTGPIRRRKRTLVKPRGHGRAKRGLDNPLRRRREEIVARWHAPPSERPVVDRSTNDDGGLPKLSAALAISSCSAYLAAAAPPSGLNAGRAAR